MQMVRSKKDKKETNQAEEKAAKTIGKRTAKKEARFSGIPRIIIVISACLLLAAVSYNVYSKYYKTGYNKGVSVASGFYFSSNYMTELDLEDEGTREIDSIEDLEAQPEIIDSLYIKASDGAWNTVGNGANSLILLYVMNYANHLLFNDTDLNVAYTIEFKLLEQPQGITYQVKKGTGAEGTYQTLTNTGKVTFTGKLEGGRLSENTYQFRVDITDVKKYTPARILALAYPTDPSYVKNTKKIAGIITAEYQASEMDITEQGFTIDIGKDNNLDNAADWQERVKEESALVYQIRTTGNYYGDGESGQRQKIKLTWNPKMYKLNKYDPYRVELEEKYKDSPADLAKYLDEEQGFMIVEILPYSSIKFVFYKTYEEKEADGVVTVKGFDSELENLSLEQFRETIHAEKVTD